MTEQISLAKYVINPEKCSGCGDCVLLCPVGALQIKKRVAILADPDSCCGVDCIICELICPQQAIKAF